MKEKWVSCKVNQKAMSRWVKRISLSTNAKISLTRSVNLSVMFRVILCWNFVLLNQLIPMYTLHLHALWARADFSIWYLKWTYTKQEIRTISIVSVWIIEHSLNPIKLEYVFFFNLIWIWHSEICSIENNISNGIHTRKWSENGTPWRAMTSFTIQPWQWSALMGDFCCVQVTSPPKIETWRLNL